MVYRTVGVSDYLSAVCEKIFMFLFKKKNEVTRIISFQIHSFEIRENFFNFSPKFDCYYMAKNDDVDLVGK